MLNGTPQMLSSGFGSPFCTCIGRRPLMKEERLGVHIWWT